MNAQAFINNVSFPKTLQEMLFIVETKDGIFDMESLVLSGDDLTEWTAPKWAQVGDICFFYHAKTAISSIRKLKKEFRLTRLEYTEKRCKILEDAFDRAENIYSSYGGRIFAIAKVSNNPISMETSIENSHFKSRVFAEMDGVHILSEPLSIDEFSSVISISSYGAITKISEEVYSRLLTLIINKNDVPKYVNDSIITPLRPIANTNYWWLNAAPRDWEFSAMKVGEEVWYELYNERGNKRQIFQNFLDAKIGDFVIGYESSPNMQITALLKVSGESDGTKIYFEMIEALTTPIKFNAIKDFSQLGHMEFFLRRRGSLFRLTNDEYSFLYKIVRGQNPEIAFDDNELIDGINDTPFTIDEDFSYNSVPKTKSDLVDNPSTGKKYPRDKRVSINALIYAEYRCEYDSSHLSFKRKAPPYVTYTEPHHLIPLSAYGDFDYSLDVEENICSLCSTCHNCLHYGKSDERDKILEKLYEERKGHLAKVGLEITLNALKKYY